MASKVQPTAGVKEHLAEGAPTGITEGRGEGATGLGLGDTEGLGEGALGRGTDGVTEGRGEGVLGLGLETQKA